jgi:AhpD family alkylhydroperoxidase
MPQKEAIILKSDDLLTELVEGKEKLAEGLPEEMEKFEEFADSVMEEGALSKKHKKLIAMGAALAKRCEYCIVKNLKEAIGLGATKEEILETCSVIILLDGGPGMAYSTFLINKYEELTE